MTTVLNTQTKQHRHEKQPVDPVDTRTSPIVFRPPFDRRARGGGNLNSSTASSLSEGCMERSNSLSLSIVRSSITSRFSRIYDPLLNNIMKSEVSYFLCHNNSLKFE